VCLNLNRSFERRTNALTSSDTYFPPRTVAHVTAMTVSIASSARQKRLLGRSTYIDHAEVVVTDPRPAPQDVEALVAPHSDLQERFARLDHI